MARRDARLYGGRGMVGATVGPGLLVFSLFVLWPVVRALAISLYSWTGFSPGAEFVGLANYRALWFDGRFWTTLRNTLYFVAVGGALHFVFAFLFASALENPRLRGRRAFQTLLVFPAFVSVVGVAILWARLYDPEGGLLNRILRAFGHHGVSWLSAENGMAALVGAAVWAGVGTHMLVLLAGLRRIPPSYANAARMDGANELQVFLYVTLPMLKGVTYSAITLWVIGGMQVFGLIQALAGPTIPPHLDAVATYQYAISFNARDNVYFMGRGAAMAVVLALLILALVAAIRAAFGKQEVEY